MEEIRNASPYCNGEDRISKLPDSLIHHIMSFNDTKFAVQTCVLSKRWIDVWKSLPILNFDRESFARNKKDCFIMFVDMVFIFRRQEIDIQLFSMDWEKSAYDITVKMNLNRWFLNAVTQNVQEIRLYICQFHNSAYEMPHRLLNCKSLRKLYMQMWGKTSYVNIILPKSINLPQLKVLFFSGLSISDVESSKRLISGCPVLQTLSILDCDIQTDNQRNFIVDSISLEKFVYHFQYTHRLPPNDTMSKIVKLCAPNLEEFRCRSFLTQDYSLENSSPLFGVGFYMFLEENVEDETSEAYSELPSEEKDVYAKRIMQFLGAVHMVRKLSLSSGFLEVLSRAPDLLDRQPSRLCNLLSLCVEMWFTRSSLRAISYLLRISPKIEEIYIKSANLSKYSYIGDDWEIGLSLPAALSYLKYVRIEEVEGLFSEFKLLRFLLKNANILEKVNVFFCSSVGSYGKMRQVKLFKDNLRAVAAASSSVKLVFR